jgi:hypothetical protein
VFRSVLFVALLGCVNGAGAAGAVGVATIVEGRATVIRSLSKFDIAPGVRLQSDDLVRTGKGTFLRIEYDDGAKVDLGSDTSIQLNPPARRKSDRPGLYVMSGLVKLIAGKSEDHATAALGSPQFDIFDVSGAVVARIDAAAGAAFAEQGRARCVDRRGRATSVTPLQSGDFVVLRRDEAVSLSGHAPPDFVASLPRQFLDPLPSTLSHFARETAPKGQALFTYAEVEAWINAEAPIRRQFVKLWRAKADDDEFRASLEQGLSRHPEWGPVLYPELYEPKPKPLAAPSASGPVAGPVAAPAVPAPVAPAARQAAVPLPAPIETAPMPDAVPPPPPAAAGTVAGPLAAPRVQPPADAHVH